MLEKDLTNASKRMADLQNQMNKVNQQGSNIRTAILQVQGQINYITAKLAEFKADEQQIKAAKGESK